MQDLTFAPSEGTQWFVHYTPAKASYETISYRFQDGDETRLITVHYNNGGAPRPTSFVRKHLIEEFTGQGCGWCPGGMDNVHEFMGVDPNWILVMHHTYTDNLTVSNSNVIAQKLGVGGAPYVTLDRARTNYGEGSAIVFHPGYLPYTDKAQFDTTTYASIELENRYDSLTRELKVKVSGLVLDTTKKNLKLTVIVKESGVIAMQYDFVNGNWPKFCHTNLVRVFLTSANGKTFALEPSLKMRPCFVYISATKAHILIVIANLVSQFNDRPYHFRLIALFANSEIIRCFGAESVLYLCRSQTVLRLCIYVMPQRQR